MPKIKKTKEKKYHLPQYDGLPQKEKGWMILETPLRMNDFEKLPSGLSETEQQRFVIVSKIKDWNFSDENGKKLDITTKNYKLIDMLDQVAVNVILEFDKILSIVSKLKKKRSTSTL